MPPPISGSKFCLICELCSLDLRFALRFVVCKLFVRRAIDWFLDKPYIGWQEWTFITSWFAIFVKFGPVFFLKRFKSMMKKLFQPKIKCHIYTHHTQISLWRSIWLLYLRKKLRHLCAHSFSHVAWKYWVGLLWLVELTCDSSLALWNLTFAQMQTSLTEVCIWAKDQP